MKSLDIPVVSVIIPTYNSAKTLVRTLESALRQTHHCEVIVIDDGSTDNTKDVIEPYVADGRIIYLYQKNAGCGVARNYGISIAQGEYIALLDADDYWHDEKIERQLKVFRENPKVVVCSTEAYLIDPFSELIWETRRGILQKLRSGYVVPFLAFHSIVTLSSALVRKDVLQKIGGFETDYGLMMVADLDLWLKLAPLGDFYAITIPLTFYQTRVGITRRHVVENYRQIKQVFANRLKTAPGASKFWYALGWLRASVFYKLSSMKIVYTIKKIGIMGVIKELLRRAYLRIDFLVYPYLMYMLSRAKLETIDELCNFSYRNSLRLLIPGQVESEIRTFLKIVKERKPKIVLEIGTAHGGNLFLLTKIADNDAKVMSIDLPNGDYGGGYFARKQAIYHKFATGSQKMFLIRDDSHKESTLGRVQEIIQDGKIDLLFIDADHSYEGVKSDFEMYSPLVKKGGLIAFHDIANDPDATYGVNKFWNEIKNNYQHYEIIDNQSRIGYGIGVIYF